MRVKTFFIYLFLFSGLFVKAQLPILKSNTTDEQKQSSDIYNNFHDNYDFVISCNSQSYWWSDKKIYEVLAYGNGHWERISLYSKRHHNGKWSKPYIKIDSFDNERAEKLIELFNKNDFWHLSNDSLNIHQKRINDTLFKTYDISDDVNYKFEIMTKNDFLIIQCYAPEYFLEKIPEIKSREVFIKCRDEFLSAYKSDEN
ncbi:MAG TPA: hypothetical protein VHE59_14775 [Mucilaginibacter sp.]|nr:hypothetical protein [Mucilaginibacter sp.]